MAKIGLKIKLQTSTWRNSKRKLRKTSDALWDCLGADYPDAENFYSFFWANRSPGANGSGYSNPEFDKLFKVASILQDSPKRTSMYETMYKMAAEEVLDLWCPQTELCCTFMD